MSALVPGGRRLSRQEAAEYLLMQHGVRRSPATLAKLACIGGGPPFARFGHGKRAKPLYSAADLDAWVAENMTATVRNTSEVPA